MLSINEHATVEEASRELVVYILNPHNWITVDGSRLDPESLTGQNPAYQCRVGKLRICASVDVTPRTEVFIRVAFRAPGLTPHKAADHLEAFMQKHIPFWANTEWQVEIDPRRWIHFSRKYTAPTLRG